MQAISRVTVSRRLVAAFLLSASLPVLAVAANAEPKPSASADAKAAATNAQAKPGAAPAAKPATLAPEGAAPSDSPMSAYLKAPLFEERFSTVPVATVDDDVITLGDLGEALATTHEDRSQTSKAGAATQNLETVLNRLIAVHLIALEARDMEMDRVDEVKTEIDKFKAMNLRQTLQAKVTKDVKADPADLKATYEELAREWKVRSVLFDREESVKEAHAQMKTKGFEEVAKAALASKKAKDGSAEGQYMARDKMLPPVLAMVEKAPLNTPLQPFRIQSGYVLMQVDGSRVAEDAKKRAEAERIALSRAQTKALEKFYADLRKKYLKENRALLKTLDFHAKKPGYKAYEKDRRVLAMIQGEKPITVADFTAELEKQFFHGIQKAIDEKAVNSRRGEVYDSMVYKRMFSKEARLERIDESDEYKRACAEFEMSVLFTAFINKAVIPDVKVSEDEAKQYYDAHGSEFAYPAMYRLDSMTFKDAKLAQATLEKLKAGTDFKFLKGNSEGQVGQDERAFQLDGTMPVTAKGLPNDLVSLLSGTKGGDYRLWAGPRGQSYVIQVLEVTPASQQPFEKVKDGILKKVFNQNADKAVQEWAGKLRKARDVKVYVSRIGA
jgi:parvulin-like peptidyl-prolyl isomerase